MGAPWTRRIRGGPGPSEPNLLTGPRSVVSLAVMRQRKASSPRHSPLHPPSVSVLPPLPLSKGLGIRPAKLKARQPASLPATAATLLSAIICIDRARIIGTWVRCALLYLPPAALLFSFPERALCALMSVGLKFLLGSIGHGIENQFTRTVVDKPGIGPGPGSGPSRDGIVMIEQQ